MGSKTFEDYVIRTIVDTVDYDAEQEKYIVNNIVLTDEILSKILNFARQNRIEDGKAREIISNIVESVSVESEVSYHQTNVNTNDIRPGCIFVLFFNNTTYGRLSIEFLALNDKRSYLVLDTNIPGLKYRDILESRNLFWNYGFAIDFGILRNGNYYPGPSNYLLLEKFDGIEYHTPTYIHRVLDKFHNKEQKGNLKKGQRSILQLIVLVNLFVLDDFSKDNYNILLSDALKCNLSSFQLNILIKRAKCYFRNRTIEERSEKQRLFFFNADNIRVFQQPIIIKEHEQEDRKIIEKLRDEITILYKQKDNYTREINSLNRKLDSQKIKYANLLKDYNDFVKKKSNKTKIDIEWDTVYFWLVIIVFFASVLFNVITPWFLPTLWPKVSVLLTCIGACCIYLWFNNDCKGRLVWSGLIAILLSTILTTYGLFGGFSEVEDTKGNTSISFITDKDSTIINSQALRFPFPKDFVQIPGGIFNKYSGSENRTIIESLVDSFYIGKYEVLQKDYERVMGLNPSRFKGDSIPVHGMSVHDAVLFCNKISNENGYDGFYEINDKTVTIKENGNGYRLPTEEEWILASRKLGASKIANHIYANSKTNIENVILEPHIVGGKKTDGQLLYDMFGNICELCIRSNGEIWGKGGSYQNRLQSENNEKAGFRAADNISSTKKLKDIFGLRLVFIPKNL